MAQLTSSSMMKDCPGCFAGYYQDEPGGSAYRRDLVREKELLQLLPNQLPLDEEVKWSRRLCIIEEDVSISEEGIGEKDSSTRVLLEVAALTYQEPGDG